MHGQIVGGNDKNGTVRIAGECVFTGIPWEVEVPAEGLKRYNEGELMQNAFPNVSAEDRECLISGISPKGWKETFGE